MGEKMECLNLKCGAVSHIICLSQSFLTSEDNQMIPIEVCSKCFSYIQKQIKKVSIPGNIR